MIDRERAAIMAVFLVNGFGIGIWAAFIPLIKERLALTDATLAIVLFCAAVGAIVAMPISGALCDRYGSRRMTAICGTCYGVTLACATAAPALLLAAPAALLMGGGNGGMDVAMNVNGVTLQNRVGRPIMSALHGLFSTGTFVAAGMMAGIVAARIALPAASVTAGALVVAVALICRPFQIRESRGASAPAARKPRLGRIPPRLLLLGVAAICGAVSEGTLVEWSGVYLRESLHVGISAALGGFTAYAIAMSVSRFCGDAVVERLGPVTVIRASGILAAAGLAIALVVHTYVAVLVGFFIAGLGLGNVSPLVYGAGGDDAQTSAGAGVAVITTLGYAGFLIGPALIGYTASRTSIDVAFALIAVFAGAIALLAPVLRRAPITRSG